MSYVPTKEVKIKERQDKFLRAQLEKEREQALLEEIEKTEKERVKKKGLKVLKQSGILDAYQGLLVSLCKYGLPTEDLYEFSALTVLKHEKKIKVQRKKELEERLQKRNQDKQLNPVRARAVSNNAAATNDQQQLTGAAGVSPNANAANAKNRVGSKRRVIGASSVERPQVGQKNESLTNLNPVLGDAKQKRSKKAAAEDENPFVQDQDSQENDDERKARRRRRRQEAAEEEENKAGSAAAGTDDVDDGARKKKKKKRTRDESAEEVKSSLRGLRNSQGSAEEEEAPAKKKKKKRARDDEEGVPATASMESVEGVAEDDGEAPRKKKKKRRQEEDEP